MYSWASRCHETSTLHGVLSSDKLASFSSLFNSVVGYNVFSSLKPPHCKAPWLDNRIFLSENSDGFISEQTTWMYSLSTLACVPETSEGVLIDETPAQLFNFEETQDQWQHRGASFNNQLTFDSSQQGRSRGLPIGGKNKCSCQMTSEQINTHPQSLMN